MLAPGLAAAGLIAFTLSVDDFVITFFVAGPGATTLPIRVYSMIKHGATPLINALSTLLLVLTFTTVLVSQRLSAIRCPKIQNHGVKPMKSHARSLALAAAVVVVVLLAGQCGGGKQGRARPAPLHLVRLHQARAGLPLRGGEPLPGRHRHLRLERGDVRQAEGRCDRV